MKILITTPYAPTSQNGNSVSGRRIRDIFLELGHHAELVETPSGGEPFPDTDLLVALNAKKSGVFLSEFKRQYPDRPMVVFLTGTDLHMYLDSGGDDEAIVVENMAISDAVVVSQAASLTSIPKQFTDKSHVVPKSIVLDVPSYQPSVIDRPLSIVSAFHYRSIKNPDQLTRATQRFDSEVELSLFGRVGNSAEELRFLAIVEHTMNFRLHGEVPRNEYLQHLSKAHVFLNTSLVEGGSNAVLEAMQIGVPVLATNIAGNRGFLGDDYCGYFEPENDAELHMLLERCRSREFRQQLASSFQSRLPLFSYESERQAWSSLIRQVV